MLGFNLKCWSVYSEALDITFFPSWHQLNPSPDCHSYNTESCIFLNRFFNISMFWRGWAFTNLFFPPTTPSSWESMQETPSLCSSSLLNSHFTFTLILIVGTQMPRGFSFLHTGCFSLSTPLSSAHTLAWMQFPLQLAVSTLLHPLYKVNATSYCPFPFLGPLLWHPMIPGSLYPLSSGLAYVA